MCVCERKRATVTFWVSGSSALRLAWGYVWSKASCSRWWYMLMLFTSVSQFHAEACAWCSPRLTVCPYQFSLMSCSPHPGGKRQLPHPQRDSLHHLHPQDPTQPTLQKQKPRLQSPQPKWWPSRLQSTLPNRFQNRPLGWPVNRNPATHPAPKPCRPGPSEVPGWVSTVNCYAQTCGSSLMHWAGVWLFKLPTHASPVCMWCDSYVLKPGSRNYSACQCVDWREREG